MKLLKVLLILFASLKYDKYSKPLISSWDFIINKILFTLNINNLLNKKIYYIGMLLVKRKFSDTDIKFALNNNFRFKTPEQFLKITKKSISINLNYPNIKYYTIKQQDKIFNNLFDIISSKKKIYIMLIGFPASGKSFIRNEIINNFKKFKYINNDDTKDNIDNNHLISNNFYDYNFIIDDNTNMYSNKRTSKLNMFKYYYKIGIFFDYNIDIAFHLNYFRMFWYNEQLVPKVSFYTLNKYFNKDDINNKFDNFIIINKIFNQFNHDNKVNIIIKYF